MTPQPTCPQVSIGDVLPWMAAQEPDKTALITAQRSFTYGELDRLSDAVAMGLLEHELAPGDVVSLFGQNSWQWLVSYHGVLKAGGVVNPVNVMLTGPELRFVLDDCQARALLIGPELLDKVASDIEGADTALVLTFDQAFDDFVAGAPAGKPPVRERAPRDLGSIGYTSGTTGVPKGAMQSLESVLLNCAYTATMHGKVASDVVLTSLPAAHVYGNVAMNGTFLAGGTLVLMERFDAKRALELIAEHRVTVFEGVPTMYSIMLDAPTLAATDLSSLRTSTVGGQTFSHAISERWEARAGVQLLDLWGMTELSGLGTTHAIHAKAVHGSCGVALPATQLAIAATDGSNQHLAAGEVGELLVRGPLVMLGYLNRPEATAETLDVDGWLHTGDLARMDADGHVYIVDRLKDMFVTSGYNVYPAEIERVLAAHPDVAMVGVGAQPDAKKGELAVAYIVPAEGRAPDAEAILAFCAKQLAAYKKPRRIVFVNALPTTSSGKIMRRKLAELDQPQQAPSA